LSAGKLREKAEKTGKAVRWAGHSNFLLKRRPLRERSGVKRLQPKVFSALCAKALCGKESANWRMT